MRSLVTNSENRRLVALRHPSSGVSSGDRVYLLAVTALSRLWRSSDRPITSDTSRRCPKNFPSLRRLPTSSRRFAPHYLSALALLPKDSQIPLAHHNAGIQVSCLTHVPSLRLPSHHVVLLCLVPTSTVAGPTLPNMEGASGAMLDMHFNLDLRMEACIRRHATAAYIESRSFGISLGLSVTVLRSLGIIHLSIIKHAIIGSRLRAPPSPFSTSDTWS